MTKRDDDFGYVPEDSLLPEDMGRSPSSRRSRQLLDRLWARAAKRWVPESLRTSRVDPGPRAWLALMALAAVAAVVAAVGAWWTRPVPRPVAAHFPAPSMSSQLSGGPKPNQPHATAGPVSASTPAGGTAVPDDQPIYVSVTGCVVNQGLVRLPPRARVADAISAAGGLTAEGTLLGLNLAVILRDGDAVVVGSAATASAVPSGPLVRDGPGISGSTAKASARVNLNTATVADLDALPGVGPATAAAIIAWRTENGPFTSVDQLMNVPGIGAGRLARLAPLVAV